MKYSKSTITKKHVILIFLSVVVCTSCFQDVIDIDLSEIDKQIVIQGNVTDQAIPCRVLISKTASIYNASSVQKVSGAIVTISDDTGNSENLNETSPGVYQTNQLQGDPGRTYTLNVIAEGRQYTASSKMPSPIELDSISCEQESPSSTAYKLSCYFTDQAGIEDYCRIKLFRNYLLTVNL
jgi:hypothetical protein